MYADIELVAGITELLKVFHGMLVPFVIAMVMSLMTYQLLCFAAYSLGQYQSRKILFSVLAGVGLYIITQTISLVIIAVVMLVQPELINQLATADIGMVMDKLRYVIYLELGLQAVYMALYYVVTVLALRHRMDLE